MKIASNLTVCSLLVGAGLLGAQSTSPTTNPQDVPKQQAPGTNNPDIGKQRRPAPGQPDGSKGNTNSADVPEQQPGTNNPDVAKQRQENTSTAGGTDTASKKHTGSQKKAKRKSTSS